VYTASRRFTSLQRLPAATFASQAVSLLSGIKKENPVAQVAGFLFQAKKKPAILS